MIKDKKVVNFERKSTTSVDMIQLSNLKQGNKPPKITKKLINLKNSNKFCKNGHHELQVGDIFCGRYKVCNKLESGGCSTVWRCKDLYIRRYVALKVVSNELNHTKAALHEINMMKSVKPQKTFNKQKLLRTNYEHKVTQLLDYFKITGINCTHVCLVMELMEGDLVDLFNSSEGEETMLINLKNIIRQILKGLDHLHTKCKLIHTDLKAENVLYNIDKNYSYKSKSVTVKIADLGSACSVNGPKSLGRQTQNIMSHEFLLGAPYGTSADIWSMACLSFYLATGFHLFEYEEDEVWNNEEHLANTIALLGEIPKHVALSGVSSHKYFNKEGKFKYTIIGEKQSLFEVLTKVYKWKAKEASQFADFLLPMLNFDPQKRSTARSCLKHPWLNNSSRNILAKKFNRGLQVLKIVR